MTMLVGRMERELEERIKCQLEYRTDYCFYLKSLKYLDPIFESGGCHCDSERIQANGDIPPLTNFQATAVFYLPRMKFLGQSSPPKRQFLALLC
nr:hypothetical protein HmN_000922900 [Hymenolepis microstoma]CUU98070.1 hypothetical transcript [Hymenolepis microstoma]